MKLLSLSEGNLIILLQVMNNSDEINYYFKNYYQNKQKRDFREAHVKSLNEMEELKRFQGSTFDECSRRRRLIENQDTIRELTARIQELMKSICQREVPKSAVFVGLPIIFGFSSLRGVEWISVWPSWLASRIQSYVWVLTITRYMRWCVSRYLRNHRIESSWIRWWRRRCWIYKNVSRYTMRVPNAWRPIVVAQHSLKTA